MPTDPSRSDRPGPVGPADVPFIGWSRAAHEFRTRAAEMAPGGYLLPLIVGDPGVGKRTMARAWLRVAGLDEGERPIVNLDTWRDELPDRCIAVTTRRPAPDRPCFLLESGTWGAAPEGRPGTAPLPADLLQRFAITLYMPPLRGHREIDILALLDYWNKACFADRYGVRYSRVDADLVYRMLFEDDWPANLEGISRVLRRIAHSDSHDRTIVERRDRGVAEIRVLKARRPHLYCPAHPVASQSKDLDGARPVEWACGAGELPLLDIPTLAVRLYLGLCQLDLESDTRPSDGESSGTGLLRPGDIREPRPALSADDFARLTEEQFARDWALAGLSADGARRTTGVAALTDRGRGRRLLGTDFPSLQGGLVIDPDRVASELGESYSPAPVVTGPAPGPGEDRRAARFREPGAARVCATEGRFCIVDGIYEIRFRMEAAHAEKGRFPQDRSMGLAYYRHLLQHPEQGFSSGELERAIGRKESTRQQCGQALDGTRESGGTSCDPIQDDQAKRQIAARLAEIARDQVRAERQRDWGELARLEREREQLAADRRRTSRNPREERLEELHRKLKENAGELEKTQRDADHLVIQELHSERQELQAEVVRIVLSSKDKPLDKSAKEAKDRVTKAMAYARSLHSDEGMPKLAHFLKQAVKHDDGSWQYRPTKSSPDWLT